ncbi:peptidase s45 penicillin amidase [Anaeramoeba flamelloides]|uniref:Peptidase s45 penicillin amidase n=1 Tax=Anaeramoeba flamelloides TaxID=1746091 RepID=A0ABQ8YYS4_9EUKA|nr:peptidase s45 penicillin amidase [Anaeramoeba flamelloides]
MNILILLFVLLIIIFLTYKYRFLLISKYLNFLSKKALPDYSGKIYVEDLVTSPVEISRDKHGIPHISAKNESDLYFGVGYCQAQDRFFQMDMIRKLATGRLSELLGKNDLILASDTYFRAINVSKIAQMEYDNCSEQDKELLLSYSAGVNYCIKNQKFQKKLPVEYTLLKSETELWEPQDSMVVLRFLAIEMNYGFVVKNARNEIISRFGEDPLFELEVHKDFPKSKLFEGTEVDFDELCKSFNGNDPKIMSMGFTGSNAFVVSGKHTNTGKPILVSDPHLGATNPSPLYWAHCVIEGEEEEQQQQEQEKEKEKEQEQEKEQEKEQEQEEAEKEKKTKKVQVFHTIGATIPGLPTTIIGRNKSVAWGITLALTDSEFVFAEKVKGTKYFYEGKWHEGEVVTEMINIKGEKKPHVINIMKTPHGPVLDYDPLKVEKQNGEQIRLALWLSSLFPPKTQYSHFTALKKLVKCDNVYQFRENLKNIEFVSLNFVFADSDGNIGHQLIGKYPERSAESAAYPIYPGWLSEFDFKKFVPADDLPHSINPECGYFVSTNNRNKGDWPFLGKTYLSSSRFDRISELIEEMIQNENKKINAKDLFNIVWDMKSLSGTRFVQILKNKYDQFLSSHEKTEIQIMWQQLRNWDGMMEKDSVGASLYQNIRTNLYYDIIYSKIQGNLGYVIFGKTFNPVFQDQNAFREYTFQNVNNLIENADKSWWVKQSGSTIEKILENAFLETINFWETKKGLKFSRIDQWTYGKMHKLELFHSFSLESEAARSTFNSKSVEIGGCFETVFLQATPDCFPAKAMVCSGLRAVFDLNDMRNTEFMLSSGNSSNCASEFSLNHFDLSLKRSTINAFCTKDEYLKNEKFNLQLIPKNIQTIETKKQK